tara:strand:- start:9436 stop:11742 length:2307 start_codon:yes stop_codon:yes gene_type:complete
MPTPEEKKLQLTNQYNKEIKAGQKVIEKLQKELQKGNLSAKERLKLQKEITKLTEDEHKLRLKIRNVDKEIADEQKKSLKYTEDIAKKLLLIDATEKDRKRTAQDILGPMNIAAEMEEKKAKHTGVTRDLMEEVEDIAKDVTQAGLDNLQNKKNIGKEGFKEISLEDKIHKIKKLQNILANKDLKLDAGQKKMLKNRLKDLEKSAKLEGKKAKGQAMVNTMQKKAKENMISQVFQGGILIGLLKLIWKLVTAYNARLDEIGGHYGAIGLQNEKMKKDLLDAGTRAQGIGKSFEDVAGVIDTLNTKFGIALDMATEMSVKVLDTAKALAISNEESADLFGTLTEVFDMTLEQTDQFMKQSALLAKMNKVAPQKVMKDIARSTEYIAKYGTKNLALVTKTAIQAAKWGGSLKDVEQIADGLLDYETSLNNQMQAQIMFGRQINMQRARQLAMSGEHSAMMEEVRNQLGDQSDMLSKSILHRRVMAQLLNVDLATMTKLVSKEKEALTIQGELAKQPGWEEILGEESVGMITDLTLKFKELVAVAVEELGPVFYKFFDRFGTWLKSGSAIDDIKGFVKGLAAQLDKIPGIVGTIISAFIALKIAALGVAVAQAAAAIAGAGAVTPWMLGAGAVITGLAIWGAIAMIQNSIGSLGGGGGGGMSGPPPQTVASFQGEASGVSTTKNSGLNDFLSTPGPGRMFVGPEGVQPINNSDFVQGSTKIGGGNNIDLGPMVKELKDMKRTLSEIKGQNEPGGVSYRQNDEQKTILAGAT